MSQISYIFNLFSLKYTKTLIFEYSYIYLYKLKYYYFI